ncbi:MAG: peptide ABC transporter substrate-binding protein, partial [Oscillospiraceae bacterium]|nr:peptide ABC transporter substrate-binding protein [Oscillospiraceae bacterium]
WAAGLAELGTDSVELTLIFDDEESIKLVAEFIQQELQTNLEGLSITLQPYPKKQRSDLMKAHDYDIGLCRWGPDYADPLTYMDLWTDGYTHNYGAWHSDAYMEILNKIKTVEFALDAEARWDLIKQAEQIIADESVILPVYQNANASLIKPDITGIEFHAVGLNRVFKNVKVG